MDAKVTLHFFGDDTPFSLALLFFEKPQYFVLFLIPYFSLRHLWMVSLLEIIIKNDANPLIKKRLKNVLFQSNWQAR